MEDSEEAAIRSCHQEPTRSNKGKTQKKLVKLHLHTIHAKRVIFIPEDIPIALPYM